MIQALHTIYGRKYGYQGFQAVYSTNKIISTAIISSQVRNSLDSLLDVGFVGNNLNSSAITAHSGGVQSYFSKFYDQTGNQDAVTNINANQTLASTNLGAGLDYSKDNAQKSGHYLSSSVLPLKMANDWIVDYVFRNETNANNQRSNLVFKTNKTGEQGKFNLSIRPSGSNYVIGAQCLFGDFRESDVLYTIPIGNTNTTFTLYTFTYIGGVFKFYRNGILQTPTTGTESMRIGNIGIEIGSHEGVGASGKINDFKTASLYCGSNLGSYDITNHINNMKTIHSIL